MVGLGSYVVNAVGDCNGCHSAGPTTEFASPAGNPYLLSPPFAGKTEINTSNYLGGGRDFGPFGAPPQIPHLYSRNLTPDKTGLPAGGHTYEEFVDIMRQGTDFDHVHPSCTGPGTPANCLAAPFNGDLLQVMRWPFFRDMTDHELRAIYDPLQSGQSDCRCALSAERLRITRSDKVEPPTAATLGGKRWGEAGTAHLKPTNLKSEA